MLTRRIAVGVCALCLAIPAAAGASPGAKPAEAKGPYGLNPPGPRSTVQAKGPYGLNPPGPRITVKAKGPYGIALPGPRGFYKGITPPPATQHSARPVASHGQPANDWRAAAISEGALLALLVLAATVLLPARRRGARLVT